MATVELKIDASELEGFAEFLKASEDLDRTLDAPDVEARLAAVDRWRKAMRALKGDVVVNLRGVGGSVREVGRVHVEVSP